MDNTAGVGGSSFNSNFSNNKTNNVNTSSNKFNKELTKVSDKKKSKKKSSSKRSGSGSSNPTAFDGAGQGLKNRGMSVVNKNGMGLSKTSQTSTTGVEGANKIHELIKEISKYASKISSSKQGSLTATLNNNMPQSLRGVKMSISKMGEGLSLSFNGFSSPQQEKSALGLIQMNAKNIIAAAQQSSGGGVVTIVVGGQKVSTPTSTQQNQKEQSGEGKGNKGNQGKNSKRGNK